MSDWDEFEEKAREIAGVFGDYMLSDEWREIMETIASALRAADNAGYERGMGEATKWHDEQCFEFRHKASNEQYDEKYVLDIIADAHEQSAAHLRALKEKAHG